MDVASEGKDIQLSVLDAFYMSVITVNSVGFGDFSPQTQQGRAFAIFWILCGTTSVAHLSGMLAEKYLQGRQRTLHEHMVREMSDESSLLSADMDCDGQVTELEYILFMLMRMKKVEPSLVELLRRRFRELDTSGDGAISPSDFAKRRMANDESQFSFNTQPQSPQQGAGNGGGDTGNSVVAFEASIPPHWRCMR